jgi:hypothetical protein
MGMKLKSWTLREEHGIWVFENRVLRRILGLRGEITGRCRKLHNEEVCTLRQVELK